MKYYCILAINKSDPSDILGLVEHSWHLDWAKDRVNMYTKLTPEDFTPRTSATEWARDHGGVLRDMLKGQSKRWRKQFTCAGGEHYHEPGRSWNELQYKHAKDVAERRRKEMLRKGYDVRVCRVGSKHCPVLVDLSERRGMELGRIKYDKFKWRNPTFRLAH